MASSYRRIFKNVPFLFFFYYKKRKKISRIIDFILSFLFLFFICIPTIIFYIYVFCFIKQKRTKDDHIIHTHTHIFAIMIASHSITHSCLFSTSSMYIFILEFRTKQQYRTRLIHQKFNLHISILT